MNPTPQHIRWGIAGPGRAAARFAQGLRAVPAASLDAVWGRTPERAQSFAHRFSVSRVCDTLEQLVAAAIDAIYVATHPDTHAAICLQALAAGKHVSAKSPPHSTSASSRRFSPPPAATAASSWKP